VPEGNENERVIANSHSVWDSNGRLSGSDKFCKGNEPAKVEPIARTIRGMVIVAGGFVGV